MRPLCYSFWSKLCCVGIFRLPSWIRRWWICWLWSFCTSRFPPVSEVIKFTAGDVLSLLSFFFISLATRLLSSLSLRKLLAGNNRLQRLPDLLDHVPLEVLDLQHNKLGELPESLFYKALKWVNPPSSLSSHHPLSYPSLWCLSSLSLSLPLSPFLTGVLKATADALSPLGPRTLLLLL